jgi:hypothetical protein
MKKGEEHQEGKIKPEEEEEKHKQKPASSG